MGERNIMRSKLAKGLMIIIFAISGILLAGSFILGIAASNAGLYSKEYSEIITTMREEAIKKDLRSFAMNHYLNTELTYDCDLPMAIIREQYATIAGYKMDTYDRENENIETVELEFNTISPTNPTNSEDEIQLDFSSHDNVVTSNNTSTVIRTYKAIAYYDPTVPLSKEFEFQEGILNTLSQIKLVIFPVGIMGFMMMLASFIVLMYFSGKKMNVAGIQPGFFTKMPLEIVVALVALIIGLCVYAFLSMTRAFNYMQFYNVVNGATITLMFICLVSFVGLCMSIATRIKLGVLFKNSICYKGLRLIFLLISRFFKTLWVIMKGLPMIWKAALAVIGISVLELAVIVLINGNIQMTLLGWSIEKIILIPAVLMLFLSLTKLRDAGKAIAEGKTDYEIDMTGLRGDFKSHAENLTNISSGMTIAVEQKIKSEHMKTELITNVSHDIKTPLTSIINYTGLIANEKTDNPMITEYSTVLLKQSEKLKKLIEDLVEASKAGTGNLEIDPIACDAGNFISQAAGEYEDKLRDADLNLVCKQPEEPVMIMADPRRMWRVFDNLMNNICKYSLEGSRVYLSLEAIDDYAVITFKNTSRDELNISPDELMERFVRGDASRNSKVEGNGLGLSIAQNLTEIQNGTLNITIDGDLFKAVLRFPMLKKLPDKSSAGSDEVAEK